MNWLVLEIGTKAWLYILIVVPLLLVLIYKCLDALADILSVNPVWLGKLGEWYTKRELKWVYALGRKGKILQNVYIPKGDGETSEIDVMYITQKGIFVIESKNYSGWIFGREQDYKWTVSLKRKRKNQFYNPIKQNATHIKFLSQYLGNTVPLYSIIAFSERCELKSVTYNPSLLLRVIKRDRLYATVRDIWDSVPDRFNDTEVDLLYTRLEALSNQDEAVKLQHVADIEKRFGTSKPPVQPSVQPSPPPAAEPIQNSNPKPMTEPQVQEELICPRCGNKLVLRVATKGEHAGTKFYGCSAYPKCRYMRKA